jgi:hypothetical protein
MSKRIRKAKGKRRLYQIHRLMKLRCSDPKCNSWSCYGGKGIKVCEQWVEFTAFYEWAMAHGYADGLTIDRIDSDSDYKPANCQWITMLDNITKNAIRLTAFGKTKTITEWAKELGTSNTTISCRLKDGWSIEDAVSIKVRAWHKQIA